MLLLTFVTICLFAANDPLYQYQWALQNNGEEITVFTSDIDTRKIQGVSGEDIQIPKKLKPSNRKVRVAVIDSGVDLEHPDLKRMVVSHSNECKELEKYHNCLRQSVHQDQKQQCHMKYASKDMNHNGYPLDCHGWNIAAKSSYQKMVQGSHDIYDRIGHGTFIAGIIAAEKNNFGIEGVSQNVEILPVQVSGVVNSSTLKNPTDIIALGVDYAIAAKADIINLSIGWNINNDSIKLRESISNAISRGIIVVAAAGNDGHYEPSYPCAYTGVICVASHSIDGKLSSFSNAGVFVDIIAPGERILSTWPLNLRPKTFTEQSGYEYQSGTSYAAPFVAGAAAILLHQGVSSSQVVKNLLRGSRPSPTTLNNYIQAGNLDIKNALTITKSHSIEINTKKVFLIDYYGNQKLILNFQNTSDQIVSFDFKLKSLILEHSQNLSLAPHQSLDIPIDIDLQNVDNSDLFFDIRIKEKDIEISRKLYAQAVNILSKSRQHFKKFQKYALDFELTENDIILPFEHINQRGQDFLVIRGQMIKLLQTTKDSYRSGVWKDFLFGESKVLALYKVDLELNDAPKYVLLLGDRDQNKRLIVLNQQLDKASYQIVNNHHIDSNITQAPNRLNWIRVDHTLTPAWISFGKTPTADKREFLPFERIIPDRSTYHLYYYEKGQLRRWKQASDVTPISFLLSSSGITPYYLTSQGQGFYQQLALKSTSSDLDLSIEQHLYQNFIGSKLLPLISTSKHHGLLQVPLIDNSKMITTIEVINDKPIVEQQRMQATEGINIILSSNEKQSIFMSDHKIGLYCKDSMRAIDFLTSKVSSKSITHEIMRHKLGLRLSAKSSPYLSSEIISVSNNQLVRLPRWRILSSSDCFELKSTFDADSDYLHYMCTGKNSTLISIAF